MKPLIIAEIGNNHEGSLARAADMLKAAVQCGADIVKFQAGIAEGFTESPSEYFRYQKMELSRNEYDLLVSLATDLNVPIMFSVWPIDSWRWFDYRQFKYFKIAARQCTAENILRYATDNTFISVPHTVMAPERLRITKGIPMHCVSEYPAANPQLQCINYLRLQLGRDVGYSDHTIGIEACKEAIARGAVAIEKHFTLFKSQSSFRDHALSADPRDMAELVRYARKEIIR